jgi:hypothetical protein
MREEKKRVEYRQMWPPSGAASAAGEQEPARVSWRPRGSTAGGSVEEPGVSGAHTQRRGSPAPRHGRRQPPPEAVRTATPQTRGAVAPAARRAWRPSRSRAASAPARRERGRARGGTSGGWGEQRRGRRRCAAGGAGEEEEEIGWRRVFFLLEGSGRRIGMPRIY